MDPRRRTILAIVSLVALAIRVIYVLRYPDYDGDAYAHFEFALRFAQHPTDLKVHWIWLPGFHALVALMQTVGVGFRGVRLANALAQTAGPYVLQRLVRGRGRSEETAWIAAMAWAVSSLGNVLGTTALAETPFTLCIVGACLLLENKKPLGAALLLTVASSMRYEAWLVVLALGAFGLVARKRECLLASALPALAIAIYIAARRSVDGEWLWFVRETYRFTHMQRDLSTASPLFDALWLPVLLPAILLGPAILLVPYGGIAAARATSGLRASTVVALALAAFLALTYLGRGTLGQARYLTVLVPFACIAIAEGCTALARRSARVVPLVLASVALTGAIYMSRQAHSAVERVDDLRARETRAEGMRTR